MSFEKQVVSVFVGTSQYMENIEAKDVKRFDKELLEFIDVKYPDIFESIRKEKVLSDDLVKSINKATEEDAQKIRDMIDEIHMGTFENKSTRTLK